MFFLLIKSEKNIWFCHWGKGTHTYEKIQKYNCNIYSKDKLIEIMKMLTNIEYMFKFCELSIDNMIDYMVVNILRG